MTLQESAPAILDEPTLTDSVITLRPWRAGDAESLFDAVDESRDSLGQWLPWCHAAYALTDAQARIDACRKGWRDGELFSFAIHDATDGRLLGSAGLSQRNRIHHSANAGYWIRRTAQGRGLAARALALTARFGFEQLALIRVEIVAEIDNRASRRTAERAGAKFEAIARNRLWLRGHSADAAVYSLLPGDLAAK